MASLVNVIWIDVHRMYVVNNVDMSSLKAPWQNGTYKNNYTEQHKTRRTPRRNKYLEQTIFVFFWILQFYFVMYDFLKMFSTINPV